MQKEFDGLLFSFSGALLFFHVDDEEDEVPQQTPTADASATADGVTDALAQTAT